MTSVLKQELYTHCIIGCIIEMFPEMKFGRRPCQIKSQYFEFDIYLNTFQLMFSLIIHTEQEGVVIWLATLDSNHNVRNKTWFTLF